MSELSGIDDRLREIQSLLMGAGAPAPEDAPAPAAAPAAQALVPEAPAPEVAAPAAPAAPAFTPPAYTPPAYTPPAYTAQPAAIPNTVIPAAPQSATRAADEFVAPELEAPTGNVPPPSAAPTPFAGAPAASGIAPPQSTGALLHGATAPPPVPAAAGAALSSLASRVASVNEAEAPTPVAAPQEILGMPITGGSIPVPPEPPATIVPPVDGPRHAQEFAERSVIEPAEARARTIVAAAEREAARIVADARNEVDELTRQIDELVALRTRIINSMPGTPGMELAPASAPATPEPPAYVAAPVAQAPAPAASLGYAPAATPAAPAPAAAPAAAVPAPPVTTATASPSAVPPAMASWLDHGRFGSAAGTVVLTIGPFPDVVSIERFERALVTIEALQEVYLRAFESGRCIFELTMRRATPLVAEIERVSAARMTIDSETASALAATFVALASAGES